MSRPSNDERRRGPRVPLSPIVQVQYADLEEFLSLHASNLSQGGLFLETEQPHEVGALLYMQFFLRDGSPLIEAMGRVVWTRPPPGAPGEPAGMGIAFISLDERSRALVDRVVRERMEKG